MKMGDRLNLLWGGMLLLGVSAFAALNIAQDPSAYCNDDACPAEVRIALVILGLLFAASAVLLWKKHESLRTEYPYCSLSASPHAYYVMDFGTLNGTFMGGIPHSLHIPTWGRMRAIQRIVGARPFDAFVIEGDRNIRIFDDNELEENIPLKDIRKAHVRRVLLQGRCVILELNDARRYWLRFAPRDKRRKRTQFLTFLRSKGVRVDGN